MNRTGYFNRILSTAILFTGIAAVVPAANAASCWAVMGWTSIPYGSAQATVANAPCETIPDTWGWVQVSLHYNAAPNDTLWLRIQLNDSHVKNWTFTPLLVFSSYDTHYRPIVNTDVITGPGDSMKLLPYPPVQGPLVAGSRVRLRYRGDNFNNCMYSVNQNGAPVYNGTCTNSAAMVYVLDAAPGGLFRLRHEQSGQCLYTQTYNSNDYSNHTLNNWGCWDDTAMRFNFYPIAGMYILRGANSWQSPFNLNGSVQTQLDPNVNSVSYAYSIDIITPPVTNPSPSDPGSVVL